MTNRDPIAEILALTREMRDRKVNHGRSVSPTLVAWAQKIEHQLQRLQLTHNNLAAAVQLLLDEVPAPPDPNCSCHLAPPCGDCVEWGGLRGAIADTRAALLSLHPGETR